ncbi:hypothetical protein VKT23_020719 [Stygiomarasmius scandens]|uniref:DUF6532 domain-containing protein n=1 Tax=Marasmiellus scandens TaxID=2682957 RepID=A0ABR1IIH3_9AGAR
MPLTRGRKLPATAATGLDETEDELEDEEQNEPPKCLRTANISRRRQTSSSGKHKKSNSVDVAFLQRQMQSIQEQLKGKVSLFNEHLTLMMLLEVSQGNGDKDEEHEPESDDDFNYNPISFTAASTITPMTAITPPTPPPVNLARVHRRKNLLTAQTPRHAYLATPLDELDSDNEGTMSSPSTQAPMDMPRQQLLPASTISASPILQTNSNSYGQYSNCLVFAHNYVPGTAKPKAADYNAEGKAIILRAAAYYEAKIIGVGAFPDRATQIGWANKAFREACRVAGKDFEIDDRVSYILRCRGSRIRGELLSIVKEAVQLKYDLSGDETKRARQQNLRHYAILMDGMMFAYKAHTFFLGIYIHPGLSNGFTEEKNKPHYLEYLNALEEWSKCNPEVVLNIRKRMYKHAREKSGVDSSDGKAVVTEAAKTRMKLQLADRTGDTDTEDDLDDLGGVEQSD